MARLAALACLAILPAACATHVAHVGAQAGRTRVDHMLLLQPGQPQYRMDDLALFVMPMELDAQPPAFPPGIAAGDVAPVTVCVEAWLDDEGDISRLAPVHGGEGCAEQADAQVAPFEQVAVQAMHGWRFSAAAICRFPERLRAKRERGDCTSPGIELTHVPVRLTYAFTFERHAGRDRIAGGRRP
jgi:hypothetical protein